MWFNIAEREVMHLDENKLNCIYKVNHSSLENSDDTYLARAGLKSSVPKLELSPGNSDWVESIFK